MKPILLIATECGISVCPAVKGMMQVLCTIEELEAFAERILAMKDCEEE